MVLICPFSSQDQVGDHLCRSRLEESDISAAGFHTNAINCISGSLLLIVNRRCEEAVVCGKITTTLRGGVNILEEAICGLVGGPPDTDCTLRPVAARTGRCEDLELKVDPRLSSGGKAVVEGVKRVC